MLTCGDFRKPAQLDACPAQGGKALLEAPFSLERLALRFC